MASSKKPIRKAESIALRALKRENRKLRSLLDNVWDTLSESDSAFSTEDLRDVTNRARDEMIAELPAAYFYDDVTTESLHAAAEEKLALTTAVDKWDQDIAKDLGITQEEAARADLNIRLPALRRILSRRYGLAPPPEPFPQKTDEEYMQFVVFQFAMLLTETAQIPCTLRGEGRKYIKALQTLLSYFPKEGGTKTNEKVSTALEMTKKGISWPAIYREVFGARSSFRDRSDLRKTVRAHLSNERNRPRKGNQEPPSFTITTEMHDAPDIEKEFTALKSSREAKRKDRANKRDA